MHGANEHHKGMKIRVIRVTIFKGVHLGNQPTTMNESRNSRNSLLFSQE